MNRKIYDDVNEIMDEYEYYVPYVYNMGYIGLKFDAKYYNLPNHVQNEFFDMLDREDVSVIYDIFRDDLKDEINEKYDHDIIWEYTGFYGRSGGNFVTVFNIPIINDMRRYEFEYVDNEWDSIDFNDGIEELEKSIEIVDYIRKYTIMWFTRFLMEEYNVNSI